MQEIIKFIRHIDLILFQIWWSFLLGIWCLCWCETCIGKYLAMLTNVLSRMWLPQPWSCILLWNKLVCDASCYMMCRNQKSYCFNPIHLKMSMSNKQTETEFYNDTCKPHHFQLLYQSLHPDPAHLPPYHLYADHYYIYIAYSYWFGLDLQDLTSFKSSQCHLAFEWYIAFSVISIFNGL